MTKKLMIALVAGVTVLIAIAIYIVFLMPSEQVYDGVLIEHSIKQEATYSRAA
ncbi:MAG: hypothetical protein Q4F05_14830 [bacterium]|nr:hypothetical protein [bacterium]